ncbi:MAG: ribbon-helix-helix domain-containing protein [Janthinobacterium lividum]
MSLPAEMAAMVRGAVDDGDYASSSEVIRDALRDWKLKQSINTQDLGAYLLLRINRGEDAHRVCKTRHEQLDEKPNFRR